jgi:hypothetical protein
MNIKDPIIYDRCYPAILPEITFLMEDDKHLIHSLIRTCRLRCRRVGCGAGWMILFF